MSVCVCVCVCERERERERERESVCLVRSIFRFTHFLSRPRYVGDVYLYLYTESSEVRVTVCVIVL